jgi:D-serine deaminase-like pyridoxal phosphate-dependent protein
MNTNHFYLGKRKEELDTPVLLVDLDIFEANVTTLLRYCQSHQIGWRPHCKSHKSPEIARLELEAGAMGITCAKLSEAELMVEHGIGPLLRSHGVRRKMRRADAHQLRS